MTIFAHDVQMRPQDFEVELQDNRMDLSINLRLKDTRTGEVQFVKLMQEDPMTAFFVAVWAKGVEFSDANLTRAFEREQDRFVRQAEKIRQRDFQIEELQKRLDELQAAVKKPEEEEYAYVEGWDEF